ncbi:MAG TPA: ABC transporter permease, partial [Pyrinomonadaceae bacterium]|nr:ABC transporter permease [Pyrinomonadaceae bacterium]
MPYELFLALRYLRARRPRRLARVTALAAISGVAFGVAALIVALSLSNGFRDEMRNKILRGTAHITLMRADAQPMTDWRSVIARLRSIDGVTEASATTYDGALLSGESGSAYAVIRGVDNESERAVAELRSTLIEGAVESLLGDSVVPDQREPADQALAPGEQDRGERGPAITSFDQTPSEAALSRAIIGEELASRTGLRVGDVGTIISGEGTLTPLGLAPRYRRIRIEGIFRSGLYEYDATWVYVSLATAASLSGASAPSASVISIAVADIYEVAEVTSRVRERMGAAYKAIDWQEANRPLFAALALERRMGLLIIALIIIIAALNITTTLVLVVVE